MELIWEDPPVPDAPFFTKDAYDKYSLEPTVRELWAFLQSSAENTDFNHECEAEAADESKDNSCSSDDDDASANKPAETSTDTKKSKKKPNKSRTPYPDPRLPYPCVSTLSSNEQNLYLGFLMSKKTRDPPEHLKTRVNAEVMQFQRYLQDVARTCAEDYNYISQGAVQYSEEFFRACLERLKSLPHLYQIHELTSLTGGTFDPGLSLTFEKQLLIMGSVDVTDHQILPAAARLASDYRSVASERPPAAKAKDALAAVSGDANAEKLSARYEPHVCMTRDALVKLLDNHGPNFAESWELPVWVKLNPGKGGSQKKTVYVDSPLPKTEITARERNHVYHEESLKLCVNKDGTKNVFHVMTECPASEQRPSPETSQRNLVTFENDSLDFEADLTDLETFGETAPAKSSRTQKTQNGAPVCAKDRKAESASLLKMNEAPNKDSAEVRSPEMDVDSPKSVSSSQKCDGEKSDSAQDSDDPDHASRGDSDDEKLIIDDALSPSPVSPAPPNPDSPQRPRKQTRRKANAGDQLGAILRMQTAMFSSAAAPPSKCPEVTSPARCAAGPPPLYSHPTSLVKPCVSSYLERNQDQEDGTYASPRKSAAVAHVGASEQKRILSQELQAGDEDEHDYEAPDEGNLLYKLYSLQELLVMVRSSVSLTHSRKVGTQNQFVPVHVLPKLEYQPSYGVESLTRTEACRLWAETLLHSGTVSYIAHVDARTADVVLRRKLPDDWRRGLSCGFKPSNSLNILHHLLKKLTRLDEGRYLVAHKAGEPFVTLLKEAGGKAAAAARGAYDLQQIHGAAPRPPASGSVPWIPLDPAVFLPFHRAHGRVPGTFPPKTARDESTNKQSATGKKRKQQSKRTSKRNKFMKNLIQKSI